jgi:ribosomal-protein-alanine N-acetyltransferase
VRPEAQGQGHGRALLGELMRRSVALGAHTLWLEVRESNERARRLYSRWGFASVGRRKGYYPALPPQREDAIVMKLALAAAAAPAGEPHGMV